MSYDFKVYDYLFKNKSEVSEEGQTYLSQLENGYETKYKTLQHVLIFIGFVRNLRTQQELQRQFLRALVAAR